MNSQHIKNYEQTLAAHLSIKYLDYQINNGVLEITINRPKRANAFQTGMFKELSDLINGANKNPEVKAILLKANGKIFSSGNDLGSILEFNLDDDYTRQAWSEMAAEQVRSLSISLIECNKPLIALTQGAAIGFTFTFLAFFDVVLCTENTIFHAPMVKSNQGIEMCGSFTFPRIFGPHRAFELLVLCRPLKAEEALKSGFVSKILPDYNTLLVEGQKVAQELCQLNSQCVMQAKYSMKTQLKKELMQACEIECDNLKKIWNQNDFKQALISYLMKLKQQSKL